MAQASFNPDFGKYRLLAKLAQGGMAEIFLAVQKGPHGFEKVVVVKRILPELCAYPDFVQMFLDEARVAARLDHSNIVRIYDFGEVEGQYYLAMEYIPGEDLASVIQQCKRLKVQIPVEIVADVVIGAAEALHFAHEAQDGRGKSLQIVHRDVSPSNIILGYQGTVKLVDFGIARAESNITKTAPGGPRKGKVQYLAPEQVKNQPVDRRADIFALGVVMHELLTGQRLFQRDNELAMVNAIVGDDILPPSSWRPDVPPEIDGVALKALSRDVKQRYQNAVEIAADLSVFLIGREHVRGSKNIDFLTKHFGDERKKKKLRIAQGAGLDELGKGGAKAATELSSQTGDLQPVRTNPGAAAAARPKSNPGAGGSVAPQVAPVRPPTSGGVKAPSIAPAIAPTVAPVAPVVAAVAPARPPTSGGARTVPVRPPTQPGAVAATAKEASKPSSTADDLFGGVSLDTSPSGPLELDLKASEAVSSPASPVVMAAPPVVSQLPHSPLTPAKPVMGGAAIAVQPEPMRPPAPVISAVPTPLPQVGEGKKGGGGLVKILAGVAALLVVGGGGFFAAMSMNKGGGEMKISLPQITTQAAPAAMQGLPVGGLKLTGVPEGAKVTMDGNLISNPSADQYMAAGKHKLSIDAKGMLPYELDLEIEIGKIHTVPVELKPRPVEPRGTLELNCVPWCEISVNGRNTGKTSPAQLSLTVGTHTLMLSNPPAGLAKKITVKIEHNQTLKQVVKLEE
jgi:serine/threonine-protein kinase